MSKVLDKQKLVEKYAKKFANKDEKHITRGIYYAPGGDVIVTNRHYLLRIRDAHKLKDPIIMHHKTGMPIEGDYPDTSKLFPRSSIDHIVIKQGSYKDVLTRVRCAADIASRINKKFPVITLTADNGNAYLSHIGDQIQFSAFFAPTRTTDSSVRRLNAEYLHTALSVFVDANAVQVWINLNKPYDPILLTDDEHIDVLIVPVRTAEA